jgi:hypothetical protein
VARIRTIKPEFWTDGDILKLSRDARLFYIGLWNFADDNGVLEYDIITIKARIFPVDRIDINRLLTELSKIGKVFTYEVAEKKYLLVKNLTNHQVIDRERKSRYPLPEGYQLKSIEISLGREGKGKERKGKEDCSANAHLSDLEFINSLKTNEVYKGIDIDRELGKMDVWLKQHPGRKKTPRFVIKWLNRIERPLSTEIKPIPKADPTCVICGGKGKIQEGDQKGATCLCVK